jgi:hypothetical protein
VFDIVHVERNSFVAAACYSAIRAGHYLHKMPDPRTSYEIYAIRVNGDIYAGFLVFGRPQATKCKDWYGGVEDAQSGKCQVTRWQVLNLARVWIDPKYQIGGEKCLPDIVPGFTDRFGKWRTSLASSAITRWIETRAQDYLIHRPPVFLEEPYELRWLLSYCDTRLHRGVIYKASGFELYYTNENGIETYRREIPRLTKAMDNQIKTVSATNERSLRIRAERSQLSLFCGVS